MFQTDSGFESENKQKKLLIVRQNDIFFEDFLCLQLGSVPGRGGRPQSPQGALEPVQHQFTHKLFFNIGKRVFIWQILGQSMSTMQR